MKNFDLLPVIKLAQSARYARPADLPAVIHLDDYCLEVMMDLSKYNAITITPETYIDAALNKMKISDVHMLLVTDTDETILGIVSSEDIMGQKPVLISQSMKTPREEITVEMVMLAYDQITTFNHYELRHAKVGNLVQTLRHLKQRYALVIKESGDEQIVCGIFSMHKISQELDVDITTELPETHTLAELKHTIES